MSTTSFAVLAKARSKYGKHLTERDYASILACQSVAEVMVYLKSHTHYASALAEVNERDVHRGRLEMLLRQDQFYEFDSLCRYDSSMSEGFSKYVVEKTEVEQIIRFLILLNSNSTEKFIFQFPAFFAKHTSLDINKLANARDYEEFLNALSGSAYYDILKIYKPDQKGMLPVSDMENKLYAYVLGNMLELIKKKAKGTERQELLQMFHTINDYSIFSKILRLKKYYNLSPEVIRTNLLPEYCDLSPKIIDKMCAAESSAEVFKIMQSKGCGRLISKIGYTYASDISPRIQYRLAKKNIHFSNNPSVVMISYMFLAETELMNIICLIEGIRYQLDTKTIQSLLIL
ncbi:V0D/AC39 family V-type ATPase subunit [Ruminococcus sp.]|uniref:V0D/AC39 family V-type ATPase subunit n=1 Tax=Ruminococcus sp. TaxID=41978 RepID=UPI002E790463|nr:V-type ATPase subunit [Ruminococcus sp.]MEE1261746.1 V-type ATPase subunit [Ruminococcus sp.]